jgi:hypothetical protein
MDSNPAQPNQVYASTNYNPNNNPIIYNQNIQMGLTNNYIRPMNNPHIGQRVMIINPQPLRNPSIKLSPTPLYCGRCQNTVISRVITECSFANICCCLCFHPLFWLLFQVCRGKEISCNDSTHFCPNCGSMIGSYQAC